jgi:hypothetical protein
MSKESRPVREPKERLFYCFTDVGAGKESSGGSKRHSAKGSSLNSSNTFTCSYSFQNPNHNSNPLQI